MINNSQLCHEKIVNISENNNISQDRRQGRTRPRVWGLEQRMFGQISSQLCLTALGVHSSPLFI